MQSTVRLLGALVSVVLLLCAGQVFAAQEGEKGFHDQPPMTNAEVERFIADFPAFKQWMMHEGGDAQPVVDAKGQPSFLWDAKTAVWFSGKEWTPERFFYVMTHCSAAVALIRFGSELAGDKRPPDMPVIDEYEMNLVRRYEEKLLQALSANTQ
ncbi:hypothetical protein [Desulfovibrio psychrotolerans]|uniref:Lipoprotein n=1 Tax=Desulfovibrio psychrotolerans TaxID=415242 RepID=A0A7J0BYU9_9BACT|nr:hypothetical protein [Desulfovibrio psychrotolerans]GFM38342.1 hypothetical protein DSM19430T_30260 [Desulfovibrio psychrotolerans]